MSTNLCACGKPFTGHSGEYMTLVGYSSPPGHDHDDNCRKRVYVCADGHRTFMSKQNSCPACDWKGQLRCGCHEGDKVGTWPESIEPVELKASLKLYMDYNSERVDNRLAQYKEKGPKE